MKFILLFNQYYILDKPITGSEKVLFQILINMFLVL